MQYPPQNNIDVNAYTMNDRNYSPNGQQTQWRTNNGEMYDDGDVQPDIRMDNPTYYQPQQQQQQPMRGIYRPNNGIGNGDDGMQDRRLNESYSEQQRQPSPQQLQPVVEMRERPNNEFYFQTRIRNTGFWGKVKLRRGTWMVIVGSFSLCISLAIISVFWAFWYHPAVNAPCRVLGITLLIWSCFTIFCGLLSNWLMMNDPVYKYFVGSPVRWSSWTLLLSIIAITVASDLITVYYTYWHTRFVNTPMIVVSLNLYFFGSILFFVSLYKTIKSMQRDMKIARFGPDAVSSSSSSSSSEDEDEEGEMAQRRLNPDQMEERQNDSSRSAPVDLNSTMASEQDGKRKDFRKKNVKLMPRNNLMSQYPTYVNATTSQQQFNNSISNQSNQQQQ